MKMKKWTAFFTVCLIGCSGTTSNTGAPSNTGGSENAEDGDDDGETPRPPESVSAPCVGSSCLDVEPVTHEEPLARPSCPEEEPKAGSSCDISGKQCSYGASLNALCRSVYECTDTWTLKTLSSEYDCEAFEEAEKESCPDAPPDHASECTVSDVGSFLTCDYGETRCQCSSGQGIPQSAGNWSCFGPPPAAGCPAKLPNLGEGCSTAGLQCNYLPNGCSVLGYATVFCFKGQWEEGAEIPCAGL